MKYICPLLVVENIAKSRYLYEIVLGQTIKSDFGENITFQGDFALHQKEHFKKLINQRPITIGGNDMELYFETEELSGMADKIKALGLELLHDIQEQPWQQRVMRFYDYDQHIVEIGESMEYVAYRLFREGMAPAEISQITYLPPAAVSQAIAAYTKTKN